ncbi:hypothetical protein LG58_922 [Kosakonia radicincitans YD4]|nr:hypothetical protein LG58_922 [Kosakonia radicincitans YD4]
MTFFHEGIYFGYLEKFILVIFHDINNILSWYCLSHALSG